MMNIIALTIALSACSIGHSCIIQSSDCNNSRKIHFAYVATALICFALASIHLNNVLISIK